MIRSFIHRRNVFQTLQILCTLFAVAVVGLISCSPVVMAQTSEFRVATFAADVTPPAGSPLCGGLVKPVADVSEPLQALGIVIFGSEKPVVLCAVDWCEIRNRDHAVWREMLAEAAGTTPDRVAVQCLHQHNAPIADTAAEEFLSKAPSPLKVQDNVWMQQIVKEVAMAVRQSVSASQPLTHMATGEAKISEVASNRRVMGPDGRVKAVRTSSTKDPEVRAAAEGTIDPMLKTISLWNGEQKLAVLHYYATHPMSYYGDGIVSSDFVGIARERRTAEDKVPHIYFTGCGGNVTAGKYNDGSKENRPVLASRILEGMRASEVSAKKMPVDQLVWRSKSVFLPVNPDFREDETKRIMNDEKTSSSNRIATAMKLSWMKYASEETPIVFSCLQLNESVRILHLPGEPFVEYQLFAQQDASGKFVAVAGYGDGGCGYIPLELSFAEGGYEPTWAFAAPTSEKMIRQAMAELMAP